MECTVLSAADDALTLARAAGIQVRVDGEALVLEASVPPTAQVLDLLKQHKAYILTLLLPGRDGWSIQDWREFFEERAGIAEFNCGVSRDQAEERAFSCCVGEWLRRNPTRSPAGHCAHCGLSEGTFLPYLTGYSVTDPGHTWLHQGCSSLWHQTRREKAVEALALIGIACPPGRSKTSSGTPPKAELNVKVELRQVVRE